MALDVKRLAGDFGFAVVAQAVGLLVGFANTLLLPKLLPEASYGYWQLFLFYAGYAGFFGFGLIDGVYLIHGGEHREEADRSSLGSQFWICAVMQLAACGILLALGLSPIFDVSRAAVVIGVGAYLVFFNLGNYLGYLYQAFGETRRYSLSVIFESLVFFVLMFSLILTGVDTFEPYVGAYVLSRVVRLAYCLVYARGLIGWGLVSFRDALRESWRTMGVGIKLLLSNLATLLVVGFSRFIIDLEWSIEVFAVVSLALALANFFMNFTSQAAMVLFPALRRVQGGELKALFLRMRDSLSLLLPVVYVLYVPVAAFLGFWLPRYAEAVRLFALLLPLCVFNGKMDVVGMTMLKVMREEGLLLRINVVTCLASIAGDLVGAYVLHDVTAILGWTVACVVARSVYTERLISDRLGLEHGWINLGSVIVTVVALFANGVLGPIAAELVVVGAYLAYLVVFRDETGKLLSLANGLRRG